MTSDLLSREPVVSEEAFWGREYEVQWLAAKLGGALPQNCNVVGEPRIGKTSLLYHVYRQKVGLPPGKTGLYVWVRLVELPNPDSASFWRLMAARLQEEVRTAGLRPLAAAPSAEARDVFDALDLGIEQVFSEAQVGCLVFVIDDFDLLVGGVTRHDLDWLRALASRYSESLAFVISSSQPLVKLADVIVQERKVSPFPNLFHGFWLKQLNEEGAAAICRQAAAEMGRKLSREGLDFLLAEAGRHPDLLKTACEYYMAACGESTPPGCFDIARAEFRLDEHVGWLCRELWRRRSVEEQAALAALAAGQTRIADPILAARLVRRTGLVADVAGRLHIFSAVFRDWILRETAVAPQPLIDHQPAQRLVMIEGREIGLTSLENRLLGYLLDHANQVCTTDMLLENVWGGGKKTAVVEKGVNRLRAKIENDPRRPRFILSARGEGYILRTEG